MHSIQIVGCNATFALIFYLFDGPFHRSHLNLCFTPYWH